MKISSLVLPVVLSLSKAGPAWGLFQDEAGKNDFTITTAGHGIYGSAYASITSDHQSVITSSSSPYSAPFDVRGKGSGSSTSTSTSISTTSATSGGCYFTSRKMDSGLLNWRRNACSQHQQQYMEGHEEYQVRHAVHAAGNGTGEIITLDHVGMVRVWNDLNGNMISEFPLSAVNVIVNASVKLSIGVPRIVKLGANYYGGILTSEEGGEVLVFFTNEGYLQGAISAQEALAKANVRGTKAGGVPSFYGSTSASAVSTNPAAAAAFILTGWKYEGQDGTATTSFADMAFLQVIRDKEQKSVQMNKDTQRIAGSKDDLLASSVRVQTDKIDAINGRKGAVSYSMTDKSEESHINGEISGISIECKSMAITAASVGMEANDITSMHALQCTEFFTTVLISTRNGMTKVFDVKRGQPAELQWEQEEGLSHASSAFFLDKGASVSTSTSTGKPGEKNLDDEAELLMSLSFSSRIASQWKDILYFVTGGFVDRIKELVGNGKNFDNDASLESAKEVLFGLNKVVVILSAHFHKVMGVDTATKGSIAWTIDLDTNADWHKIVHGAATSRSSALGQGKHHPHSPEILVLSQLEHQVEWKCVDGLNGEVVSQAVVDVSSAVVQVIPIHGHSHANGGCKQNAALVLEDDSVVFVPKSPKSGTLDDNVYSHVIDKETGVFRSMKVHANSVEVVGETIFDPKVEKIVNVAYPQRNEVVQSPVTILGDDSLLLKYLNPHLCVVVTEATVEYMENVEGEQSDILKAFGSTKSEQAAGKKKPVGATKPGEDAAVPKQATATPTLFVNLVDTVSGQVLHRVSHIHAALGAMAGTPTNVPVLITENWVVYAFTNAKSRRTEIGVLTLHEGMIDKQGITAFSTPEQQLSFSSLTGQNPIVLYKTFGVNYPVSAIGVTKTKGGISSKNILMATGMGGKIVKIDRRLLDPRRPYGEQKKSEKMEGLLQ
jgi:hypothetical protein